MVAADREFRPGRFVRSMLALFAALATFGASGQQLTQNFDDITTLAGAGWILTNNSNPIGTTGWFQGNPAIFTSQAGAADSYIAANFVDAAPGGNVSNWLLTPALTDLQNGETLTFWTRSAGALPDRLEVRLCVGTPCTDVGVTDVSVGSFTTMLFTVNPTQAAGGYPTAWTPVSITLSGLPAGPNQGRIGFRYFVTDTSTNGDYIGIDTLNLTAGPPDLTVAKSHVGNFFQGQIGATYTITVTNSGGNDTVGTVTLVDTLPAGLTATGMTGSGWTCVLGTLTCTRSDALTAGASYPAITLTGNVAASAASSVVNTATVSGGGEVLVTNDVANDTTTIAAGPDLTVTKSHAGSFLQGQVGATYTITVTNAGSSPTLGTVTLVDTLPAGLTATNIAGGGWACVLATLTCARGDALNPGNIYPAVILTVNVLSNASATVTNTATVSGGGDVAPGNNSASDPTSVTGAPDFAVTKTHSGTLTPGQTGATYTITVSNTGGSPTSGLVTVVDTLPAGLTATSFTGTGWSCSLATLTCARSDALAPGLSYPVIALTVNVSNGASGLIINTATVSGGGKAGGGSDSVNDSAFIQPLTAAVIPTLGELALLMLAALLTLLAVPAMRRRRR